MYYVALFIVNIALHFTLAKVVFPWTLDAYLPRKTQVVLANNVVCLLNQTAIVLGCFVLDLHNLAKVVMTYFFYDTVTIILEYPSKKMVFFAHHVVSIYISIALLKLARAEPEIEDWVKLITVLIEITTPVLTIKDIMYRLKMDKTEAYRRVYSLLVPAYALTRLILLPICIGTYVYTYHPISVTAMSIVLCFTLLIGGSVQWWQGLVRQASA